MSSALLDRLRSLAATWRADCTATIEARDHDDPCYDRDAEQAEAVAEHGLDCANALGAAIDLATKEREQDAMSQGYVRYVGISENPVSLEQFTSIINQLTEVAS